MSGGADLDQLAGANAEAAALYRSGRAKAAVPIFEEVLGHCRSALGPDHPVSLTVEGNLAVSLVTAGKRREGIELMTQNVAERARVACLQLADVPAGDGGEDGSPGIAGQPHVGRCVLRHQAPGEQRADGEVGRRPGEDLPDDARHAGARARPAPGTVEVSGAGARHVRWCTSCRP